MQNSNNINANITEENSLLLNNNTNHKSPINVDVNYIKQDLLYFKNDVLKDIRKLEEKLFLKLNEQKMENSEQYGSYENKLDNLTKKLSHVNYLISDKNNLTEKINILDNFKIKTENNFFAVNSKISSMQKESKETYYKYEKLINENLEYPGIIGNNAKFPSFRFFIDFVLSNIKILNDFKEEIEDIDFNEYKKKINSEILTLQYEIDENYKNSRSIIENTIKETNSQLNNFVIDFNKKIVESYAKIENIENKIKEYFDDYQTKINMIQDDIKDKYKEQNNTIENIKNMQKEYYTKSNSNELYNKNYKSENSKKRKSTLNERAKIEKKTFDKSLSNKNFEKEYNNNTHIIANNDIPFKKILYNKQKANPLDSINLKSNDQEKIKDKNMINNSINENKIKEQKVLDSIKQDFEDHSNVNDTKYNSETHSKNNYTKLKIIKQNTNKTSLYNKIANYSKNNSNNIINVEQTIIRKNNDPIEFRKTNHSFEFLKKNNINKIDKKVATVDIRKRIKKLNSNYLQKFPKKIIFPNNYSITNIPQINFKKIVIPDPLDISNNNDFFSRTSRSDNFFITIRNSPQLDKQSLKNDNNDIRNKFNKLNINNINKIKNTNKNEIIKLKSKKISTSPKENKFDSLKIIHIKNKDYILNSFNNIKKEKNKSLSFEKYKSDKGKYITSGTAKLYKQKDKLKKIFSKKYEYLYDVKKD